MGEVHPAEHLHPAGSRNDRLMLEGVPPNMSVSRSTPLPSSTFLIALPISSRRDSGEAFCPSHRDRGGMIDPADDEFGRGNQFRSQSAMGDHQQPDHDNATLLGVSRWRTMILPAIGSSLLASSPTMVTDRCWPPVHPIAMTR